VCSTSTVVLAALILSLVPSHASANEGAAVLAMGGIQLRNERRVAMRRERLYISPTKVKVEYEFVNESTDDVVTEVAFPIPEYGYSYAYGIGPHFEDFRVWASDWPIQVAAEAKAFVDGQDVTRVLEAMGIDIPSMGHLYDGLYRIEPNGVGEQVKPLSQFSKLSPENLARLRAEHVIGEVAGEPDKPLWTVRLTYHWLQHFPPGQVVRMRHEYRPEFGSANHVWAAPEACPDRPLARRLERMAEKNQGDMVWVEYILTTANTWKTPVRDFELSIEYPEGYYVSLCWDGKLEKAGPRQFRSVLKDFIPKRELAVYFIRPPSVPVPPGLFPW
jgi:hypothetical protein